MDSEQIRRLFAETLAGDYDDDAPWEAVSTLRRTGSREICDRAVEWCRSDRPLERARGADVLAQLGKTFEHPSNNFPEECFAAISTLVRRETNPLPLLSAVHALGHIGDPLAVPLIIERRFHPNADVRFAVACALGRFADDPRCVEALLALMQDPEGRVRDWATFGLGVLGHLDSDQIRDGLLERLTDLDCDAREEALVSLAKRQDKRALPALFAELEKPEVPDRAFEAAEMFIGGALDESERSASEYALAIRKRFSL